MVFTWCSKVGYFLEYHGTALLPVQKHAVWKAYFCVNAFAYILCFSLSFKHMFVLLMY